jgi:hypothetical protein
MNRQTVSLCIQGKRRKSFSHPVMRITEKSPLWNWCDVAQWLYTNKIIKNKGFVDNTIFFANINAALEERDRKTREIRSNLLKRISSASSQRHQW